MKWEIVFPKRGHEFSRNLHEQKVINSQLAEFV